MSGYIPALTGCYLDSKLNYLHLVEGDQIAKNVISLTLDL
jgi:hypothetical protein